MAPRGGNVLRRVVLALLIALLVVSFISPFSYLPNPLGLAYLVLGGYSYDARLPFLVNRFAVFPRGNVEDALRPKLDALLGATGLDPLDPQQPLQTYQIETVTYGSGPGHGHWAQATVQMTYADGSSRRYRIPVVQSSQSWGRPGGWAYTGLDRYFAPHREVPNLTFAGPDAGVRLGEPQRLPLTEEAQQLGTGLLVGWYTSTQRDSEELAWAPDGQAFLLSTAPGLWQSQVAPLWLVRLDSNDATRVADNVQYYGWSTDGKWIVFLRPSKVSSASGAPLDVVAIDRHGQGEHVLGRTRLLARPAIIGDAVWYLDKGSVWRTSLTSASPSLIAELPELGENYRSDASLAVSADGRLAYRCGDALCLTDADGGAIRVDLGAPPRQPTPTPRPPSLTPEPKATIYPPIPPPQGPVPQRPAFAQLALAWSPTGDRLAAVASDYTEGAMPTLWVVDREGSVLRRILVGPNGFTRMPQWTPDGQWIFLNTFPEAGRRIVAVEMSTSRVYDLSQPRWDAFFSLAPDGRRLLLWNGRGGFWTVPLELR